MTKTTATSRSLRQPVVSEVCTRKSFSNDKLCPQSETEHASSTFETSNSVLQWRLKFLERKYVSGLLICRLPSVDNGTCYSSVLQQKKRITFFFSSGGGEGGIIFKTKFNFSKQREKKRTQCALTLLIISVGVPFSCTGPERRPWDDTRGGHPQQAPFHAAANKHSRDVLLLTANELFAFSALFDVAATAACELPIAQDRFATSRQEASAETK